MTESFFKFPSTPHLTDLGGIGLRSDKIFNRQEADRFLSKPIVVEEKIDGANLGISLSPSGEIRFQNRGNWLEAPFRGQWKPLRDWSTARQAAFQRHLPDTCVLFGEWCYAVHSIAYKRLPNWFIGFDVFDWHSGAFWSHDRRDVLLTTLDLPSAPALSRGIHDIDALQNLLQKTSRWGDTLIEGLYLRREAQGILQERAKLVRPDFTQQISEHWSRQPIRRNRVAYGT